MMWDSWTEERNEDCRVRLTLASYNAGFASILKAQKISGQELCWDGISPFLHAVTGRNHRETILYVMRVENAFKALTGSGFQSLNPVSHPTKQPAPGLSAPQYVITKTFYESKTAMHASSTPPKTKSQLGLRPRNRKIKPGKASLYS